MWPEIYVKPAFQPRIAAETFRNIPNVLGDSGSEDLATYNWVLKMRMLITGNVQLY